MPFDIGGFVFSTGSIQNDARAGIVTDGLVLHLDAAIPESYPLSGTTWFDYSGNGRNGTLTNGPTYNSGNGGSISFDGIDDYGIINSFPLLAPLSICSWVYKTEHIAWSSILDRYANETLDALSLGFDSSNGQRMMYMWNNTGSNSWNNRVSGSLVINTNQWYYLCVTATATTANFYVNGVFDVSRSVGQVIETGNFYIAVNLPGGDEYFKGNISQLSVYNRELSTTEIQQNFNATRKRFGV